MRVRYTPAYLRKINERIGIQMKIALIAAAFILLTVTVTTWISTYRYTQDAVTRSSERIAQMLHQLSINISGYIEDITNVAGYVYYSTDVMSALENPTDGSPLALLEKRRTVEQYLDRVMFLTKKDIVNYFIITNDEIYHGGRMQKNIDYSCPYYDYTWYQASMETTGNFFLPPHEEQLVINPQYKVVSIVKAFRSISDSENTLGVVKVDLLYSAIVQAAEIIDVGEKGGLLILDQENQIIYRDMEQSLFDTFSFSGDEIISHNTNAGDGAYLINTNHIDSAGWTVIAVTSREELTDGAIEAIRDSILLAAFLALIAVVLMFITIHGYLHPLDDLVSVMKQVENGDLTASLSIARADEISYVVKSFNSMITTLQHAIEEKELLIKRVYTAEMLNVEAQLYALQSQIKPHFLYNILNLFSIQIQTGMLDDAVNCIGKLELLFRSQTRWKKSISVEDSFQILESYLSLQKYRFADRLSYELDFSPDLQGKYYLPFILQPIVENAVVHGCENNRGHTSIRVAGQIVDNMTVFTVEDSGVGIPQEELTKICQAFYDDVPEEISAYSGEKPHHLGIMNVHKRIKLRYGNNYGLEIESTVNIGTKVTIRLPILQNKEEIE